MKGLSFWVASRSCLCRAQARACSAVKWNKPYCLFLYSGLNSWIFSTNFTPLSSYFFPLFSPSSPASLDFLFIFLHHRMLLGYASHPVPGSNPSIDKYKPDSLPMFLWSCISSACPVGDPGACQFLRVEFCFQDKGIITVSMENQPYPTGRHLTWVVQEDGSHLSFWKIVLFKIIYYFSINVPTHSLLNRVIFRYLILSSWRVCGICPGS